MYISKVTSRNYRTLVDFEMNLKPGYCAISGKNNCGKTSVLKVIENIMSGGDDQSFYRRDKSIKYDRDKTQWIKESDPISVSITFVIKKNEDSEIFLFIDRMGAESASKEEIELRIMSVTPSDGPTHMSCFVDGSPQDDLGSKEIIKRIRSSSNLMLHNSTNSDIPFFYVGESFIEIIEAHFSKEDRDGIAAAQKTLQNKISKATRQHKAELDALLGKLRDKFEVQLTTPDNERTSRYPLQIKLNDRVAEVPLHEWGAGTQNRTRVLMSILDAQHTKQSAAAESRLTPIFIVEEPESFLHPSAQAEFGQVLNSLAEEFGIQIIATTHSPYMLNQRDPSFNYLLDRRVVRRLPRETLLLDSDNDDWMRPFAENLGVVSSEFHDWKEVFSSKSSRVILVEGDIDKEYLEFIRSNYIGISRIPDDVEFVAYDGKDALKNTALLRFMINKFKRVYVTYDLDADREVSGSLAKIGLEEGKDYCAIGLKKHGYECIEGLVPDSIKLSVHSSNLEDVSSMMAADNSVRRSARQRLKKAYLTEFKKMLPPETELSHFKALFTKISHAFA